MKKNSFSSRHAYGGKSHYEKEAYRRFILKNASLETTDQKADSNDTTDSSFFEDEKKTKTWKSKKPWKLRIRDAFGMENILSNIFVGLVVAGIGALIWVAFLVYSHEDKISTLQEQQKQINTSISQISEKISGIGNSIDILKDKIPFLLEVFRSKNQ